MVHDCAITAALRPGVRPPRDVRHRDWRRPAHRCPIAGTRRTPRASASSRATAPADQIRWVEVSPCYVFHPLNAYDLPGRSCRVSTSCGIPRMFASDTARPERGHPDPRDRWTLDPETESGARASSLDDHAIEFPRHDERLIGTPPPLRLRCDLRRRAARARAQATTSSAAPPSSITTVRDRVTLEPVFVPRTPDVGRGRRLDPRRTSTTARPVAATSSSCTRRISQAIRWRRSTSRTASRSSSTATGCRTRPRSGPPLTPRDRSCRSSTRSPRGRGSRSRARRSPCPRAGP